MDDKLTREEYLVSTTIISACCIANSIDCGDSEMNITELSRESRERIITDIKNQTSAWQRQSLLSLLKE